MGLPKRVNHGISAIATLGIIMFFIIMGAFAFTFSGILTFNSAQNSNTTPSSPENVATLEDALNDLKKTGFTVLESNTIPINYSEIQYMDTYSEFKKKAALGKEIFVIITNDKCVLAVEYNNSVILWLPTKWTKLKVVDYQCESQSPGWKITIKLQNMGNIPTTINKIFIDSSEIAKNNYDTNDYIPLSTSTNIQTNTIIDVRETMDFVIRISNLYQFSKPGLVELKIVNSYGIETKIMIKLQ
jgi:hypothetical protein